MAEIKAGSVTDKGIVDKIVYLTFSGQCWPTAYYSDKPIPGGKGLVCAKIGNKSIPVGELKLISNGKQ
jgi:hypothetical protein